MFYHTNKGVDELLLCELRDPVRKKQIVQRMTTATAQLAGWVGERRQMRQNLETLVDQKEVETSRSMGQEGPGRLPAGFATFTTAPYKWAHLHDMILKSYGPQERESLEEWKTLSDAEERNAAQRRISTNLLNRILV